MLSSLKDAEGDEPAWSSNRQENAVGPSPFLGETAKETMVEKSVDPSASSKRLDASSRYSLDPSLITDIITSPASWTSRETQWGEPLFSLCNRYLPGELQTMPKLGFKSSVCNTSTHCLYVRHFLSMEYKFCWVSGCKNAWR